MQELNAQISNRLNFNYLDRTLAEDSFGDGFHLPKNISIISDMYKCDTESIASSSATSKHRIDMLFGDTRSVASEYQINRKYDVDRKVKSLMEGGVEADDDDDDHFYNAHKEQVIKNDVQVRIEKMFSEVSSSEQENDTKQSQTIGDKFVIQHLGSIPVEGKIISVDGLQQPLKELFLKHFTQPKKNTSGLIQIGDKGLQIEYAANYGGCIEKLYPFSNIAIWASLKFSLRNITCGNLPVHEYAFLPIVTNTDKSSLYTVLDEEMVQHLTGAHNKPLFTVVMREPDSMVKQLVCHGFICESSEDAVIIAATLYRKLIGKLGKTRRKNRMQQRHSQRAVPNKLFSIGETLTNEATESDENNYAQVDKNPPTQPPIAPPIRPPRKSKLHSKGHKSDDSLRPNEGRDVLTKIAIPRSGSFLNTNHLRSRYSDAKFTEQVHNKSITSPLGFVEMFNELQSQEGLKTVDEILRVIIKREGMSFNELKPIYKEFLLKLALVLSKDELYHRSKIIMKSQKPLKSSRIKKVIATKAGLKNIFHKPLVKLKQKNKKTCDCKRHLKMTCDDDGTSTDSFMLTDQPKENTTKPQLIKQPSIRQKTFKFRSQQRIISTSEDSDYPNINQKKFKTKPRENALRPSSSGYFSFSECSYDTESCTCISADKCYCSLNKNKFTSRQLKSTNYSVCSCDTLACHKRNKCYCTKQSQKNSKLSLVDQLKQNGFVVSESSLSPDDTSKKILTAKDKGGTQLSKSLEYLENGSQKYKNRMELYDTNGQKAYPCHRSYKYNSPSYSSGSSTKTSQKRSISSDNLAVDYSMFAKSSNNRNSKRMSHKTQNVIYAELVCPKINHNTVFDHNCTISPSQMLSHKQHLEKPRMLAMYGSHTPLRTCNCACSCPLYGVNALPTYKNIYGSSPFHRMNMENVFGYFP